MLKVATEALSPDGSIVIMHSADLGPQNSAESRRLANGSASGHASARALGKLAAMMANRGSLGAEVLISSDTFLAAHGGVSMKYDGVLLEETRFSRGGFGEFFLGEEHVDRETSEGRGSIIGGSNTCGLNGSFYGWGGAGGSMFLWSVEHQVGMAYTMNGMSPYILGGPRTQRIFSGPLLVPSSSPTATL